MSCKLTSFSIRLFILLVISSGSLVRRHVLTFIVNVRALEFAQHELVTVLPSSLVRRHVLIKLKLLRYRRSILDIDELYLCELCSTNRTRFVCCEPAVI